MDAAQTYLLNGLLARQFALGRIVRFREVMRGRQAGTVEVFTVQEKEYLVQVYPASFDPGQLERAAAAVNALDGERFSVVPFLALNGPGRGAGEAARVAGRSGEGGKEGARFAGEGPQGSRLMVSLAPVGSVLKAGEYSVHDVSQVGLRLAWMHRLLKEQLGETDAGAALPLAERLRSVVRDAGGSGGSAARFSMESLGVLLPALAVPAARGWVHGDVQSAAFLVDGDHQIRTVMDWGLLHAGSPLEDVVDAFLAFCTNDQGVMRERGRALLEAYDSLSPIKRVPWTPVVASWCGQRLLDDHGRRRGLPAGFETVLRNPEQLAVAVASCL